MTTDSSWQWPGSRWWRVDFHAHSRASPDFRPTTPKDNGDLAWKRWLAAARDADLHAIAVTDHNTAAAVSALQNAASRVDGAPVLFPGVELTVDDVHLLCIVNHDRQREHVEALLNQVGIAVDSRGTKNARASISVKDMLDKCDDDTLVLGAHVNGPRGLLIHTGAKRIEELRHPRLAAVEIDPDRNAMIAGLMVVGRRSGA